MPSLTDDSMLHLLHRVTQIGSDKFAEVAGESNVTVRQLVVLSAVAAEQGLSQTELMRRTGVDRSTMADILRRLQRKGLVARKRTKADARTKSVTLTSEGRDALSQHAAVLSEVDDRLLAPLNDAERDTLRALLGRLRETEAGIVLD